ncbi:MAG TPA: DNA double-strand break repair nuclease NurA [Candidatus Bathyarchaeia archaeon]
MGEAFRADLADIEKKLRLYVDKGRVTGSAEVRQEPVITAKPDVAFMKPLKKVDSCSGSFVAVDCSTRTLRRANNWGIYLMRAAYASVRERDVDWGYRERVCTVVGDAHVRSSFLQDFRIEMESQIALNFLKTKVNEPHHVHGDVRSMYLLLDGGGYFGGERKFRVSLYEECKKEEIKLLCISKNSPSLHDENGRDLVATTYMLSPYDIWVYHPVRKADKDKSLYGDIAIIKLCGESPRVFRCDIMEYLTNGEISELLSPLTSISEDPRCVGYPIALWLAHEFSAPSDAMLFSYHDQVEEMLRNAGLLEVLRREELCCSFADELHGIKHAFEWEWWGGQF